MLFILLLGQIGSLGFGIKYYFSSPFVISKPLTKLILSNFKSIRRLCYLLPVYFQSNCEIPKNDPDHYDQTFIENISEPW
jgi:hypothetical protein